MQSTRFLRCWIFRLLFDLLLFVLYVIPRRNVACSLSTFFIDGLLEVDNFSFAVCCDSLFRSLRFFAFCAVWRNVYDNWFAWFTTSKCNRKQSVAAECRQCVHRWILHIDDFVILLAWLFAFNGWMVKLPLLLFYCRVFAYFVARKLFL